MYSVATVQYSWKTEICWIEKFSIFHRRVKPSFKQITRMVKDITVFYRTL